MLSSKFDIRFARFMHEIENMTCQVQMHSKAHSLFDVPTIIMDGLVCLEPIEGVSLRTRASRRIGNKEA